MHDDMFAGRMLPGHLLQMTFVNFGCISNLSLLAYSEVRKKDGLWLGGSMGENNATLRLHLASLNLPDFQLC